MRSFHLRGLTICKTINITDLIVAENVPINIFIISRNTYLYISKHIYKSHQTYFKAVTASN